MNKKLTTTGRFPLGEVSYVSPAAAVSEIINEGVLCVSTELSVDKWETEDFTWN